jgi:hypothetical protein
MMTSAITMRNNGGAFALHHVPEQKGFQRNRIKPMRRQGELSERAGKALAGSKCESLRPAGTPDALTRASRGCALRP